MRAHFLAAEKHRRLVGEGDARQADGRAGGVFEIRCPMRDQVVARVLVRDDLRNRQHQRVAAGMVVVLMRVDDVAQRLIGDRLHLREDVVVVPVEHVVHQNHALGGHQHRDVAAVAGHHIEVVFHLLGLERPRGPLRLRVDDPRRLHGGNEGNREDQCGAFYVCRFTFHLPSTESARSTFPGMPPARA